jgi:type II secretory pathway pseudopilin PulG
MKFTPIHKSSAGMTLTELVVSSAILALVTASLLVGISTVQRTFRASQHHAKSQMEQARLIDYVARDLRRALAVSVDTYQGSERLNVSIPDYYKADGTPNNPVIAGRSVNYGDAANPVRISYYKEGSAIFRKVNTATSSLVTDVQDFNLDYTDGGQQTVQISVTFLPKFRLAGGSSADIRAATTASATILLRNKRL